MYESIVERTLQQAAAELAPSAMDHEVLQRRIEAFRKLLLQSAWPYVEDKLEVLLGGAEARDTALHDPLFDITLYFVVQLDSSTDPREHLEQLKVMLEAVHRVRFLSLGVTAQAVEVHFEPQTRFSVVPAIKDMVELSVEEKRQSIPCLLIPSPQGWVRVATPDHWTAVTDHADRRANGFLRPVIRLVKQWNRARDVPLMPIWLEVMCHGAFPTAPRALLPALATAFRHLARAVGEPCPDPTGIGPRLDEGVTPDRRASLELMLRSTADRVEQARIAAEKEYIPQAHRLLRSVLGAAYPQELVDARPVVVMLDVFPGITAEAIQQAVDIRQSPIVVSMQPPTKLTPGGVESPETWLQLGQLVAKLAEYVRALPKPDEPPLQLVIGGLAPLSLFVHLGLELSSWLGEQVFVNRSPQYGWLSFPLHVPLEDNTPPWFDIVRGMRVGDPSPSRGRVAVFVSLDARPAPTEEIDAFFQAENEELAGLVEIGSTRGPLLGAPSTSRAFLELKHLFAQVRSAYPAATGIALFVVGPAQLAYMTGLALDPNVVGSILVTQYQSTTRGYVLASRLPWRGGTALTNLARLRLQSLEVESFRGLARVHVDFGKRLTVLIGTNGSGKTSVLDALALMLAPLGERLLENPPLRRLRTEDISVGQSRARCAIRVTLNDVDLSWWQEQKSNERHAAEPQFDAETRKQLEAWYETIRSDAQASLPLTVYYSIRRGEIEIPERLRKRVESEQDRLVATYDSALEKGAADFRTFFEWFRQREDDENAERRDNALFEDPQLAAVRRAIERLLPGFRHPRIRRSPLRMVVTKEDVELSIHQLSDGERSLLALAGDLARRLSEAHPRASDPLGGSAVVLIDEVDLHLHPAWQQRVLEDLRRTFPNCQFVVTTHSPHVLSTVAVEDIRVLHVREKVVQVETPQWQTRGTESAAILAVIMGVDPTPNIREVEMLRRYRVLIQERKHQDDEGLDLRRDLEAHFGARHPLIVDCDRLIRFTSFRNERAATTKTQD